MTTFYVEMIAMTRKTCCIICIILLIHVCNTRIERYYNRDIGIILLIHVCNTSIERYCNRDIGKVVGKKIMKI